jgi:hypothetical protein
VSTGAAAKSFVAAAPARTKQLNSSPAMMNA